MGQRLCHHRAIPAFLLLAAASLVAPPSRAQGETETAKKEDANPALLTVPAGTLVEFRFLEKVKARKSSPGERVPAVAATAVIVEGVTVVQAGADVTLVVTEARRKKAGYFRTAEGYVEIAPVSAVAVDGTALPLEEVTEIAAGNKDKKFTWSAHNANLKPEDTFVAKVAKDTAIKRP